jgi:LysM domain
MGAFAAPEPMSEAGSQYGHAARLRLVDDREQAHTGSREADRGVDGRPYLAVVPPRRRLVRNGRRTSPAVRRRRTLVVVTAILLIGLALPLGGTGGRSHVAGSALVGSQRAVEYTVQPGDSLWSIAVRVDPTGDPRPLVAHLASDTGSFTVEPGERIAVP